MQKSNNSKHLPPGHGGIDQKLTLLLSMLLGVIQTQSGWLAFCPGHDDRRSRSLGIKIGRNGGIILNCFAGCSAEEVLSSVGLTFADLFPDQIKPEYHGIDGYDRYAARKAQPRFSRYELWPILIAQCYLLHQAMLEMRLGLVHTERDIAAIDKALEIIGNLKQEIAHG